jgi:predicted solute-binding protein
MEVLYLDAQNAGFANFSALDIFANKDFYQANQETCEHFDKAVKESIAFMEAHPKEALEIYYDYTKTESSELMDEIIYATLACFDVNYRSSYEKALPILKFFTEIDIVSLEEERFKTAFLD